MNDRRLRTSVHGDHSFPPVRKQEYARPASVGERRAEGRDCGHSCLDTKVLHTGAVAVVDAAVI